jgi:hypothetical protein
LIEDNWSLRSPEVQLTIELGSWQKTIEAWEVRKYSYNWTWQLELPHGYFQWQRIVKDARRCCREEGSEGRRSRKKEVETQAQTVLTLSLDQITKFVYRLDGPFGEGNI